MEETSPKRNKDDGAVYQILTLIRMLLGSETAGEIPLWVNFSHIYFLHSD